MRAGQVLALSIALSTGLASASLAAGGYNPAGGAGIAGGATPSFESAGPVSSGVAAVPSARTAYKAEGFGSSVAGGGSPSYEGPANANPVITTPVRISSQPYKPEGFGSGNFGGGVGQ